MLLFVKDICKYMRLINTVIYGYCDEIQLKKYQTTWIIKLSYIDIFKFIDS